MENFKRKETENLLFTSKLTEKNTKLQSENSILNEKVDENESLFFFIYLFICFNFKLENLINELNDLKKNTIKIDDKNKLMVGATSFFNFFF
jgi:hypothetical protein